MPKSQTLSQPERRSIAQSLPKDWPISRENRRPRGLDNTLKNNCYRHAALQNLLHLPRFLNWIRKHNEPGSHWPCLPTDPNRSLNQKEKKDPILVEMGREALGCVPCLLKKLVIEYWGNKLINDDADKAPRPFKWNNPAIRLLHRFTERKFCFEPYGTSDNCVGMDEAEAQVYSQDARKQNMVAQQEAAEFIFMILDGIETSIDSRDLPHGLRLKQEFDALFTLKGTFSKKCSNCNRIEMGEIGEEGSQIRIVVRDDKTDTVYAGLKRIQSEVNEGDDKNIISCPIIPPCNATKSVIVTKKYTIDSAPEYLYVMLDRNLMQDTGETKKVHTSVKIPDIMDLTHGVTVQEGVDPEPLRYKLLNGIYHCGTDIRSGHYAAGVTAAPPPVDLTEEAKPVDQGGNGRERVASTKYYWISDGTVSPWEKRDGMNVITSDPAVQGTQRDTFNASVLFYERIHPEPKERKEKEKKGRKKADVLTNKAEMVRRKAKTVAKSGEKMRKNGAVMKRKAKLMMRKGVIMHVTASAINGRGAGLKRRAARMKELAATILDRAGK